MKKMNKLTRKIVKYLTASCLIALSLTTLNCQVGVVKRDKIFIAKYNHDVITGVFYDEHFLAKDSFKINIKRSNGSFTYAFYGTGHATNRALLSSDLSKFYFCMYDGYEEDCCVEEEEREEIPEDSLWTKIFCYDIKSHQLTEVLQLPRNSEVVWGLHEKRNSIIYYDTDWEGFLEFHLATQTTDTLCKIGYISFDETQLNFTDNGFVFDYFGSDSILRLTYDFEKKTSKIRTIYTPHTEAVVIRGNYLLAYTIPGYGVDKKMRLISTQDGAVGAEVIVPRFLQPLYLEDDGSFFGVQENELSYYNKNIQKVKSLTLLEPRIYARLEHGLIVTTQENISGDEFMYYTDRNLEKFTLLGEINSHSIFFPDKKDFILLVSSYK